MCRIDQGEAAMTSKAALFALMAIWGVGLGGATLPARADELAPDTAAEAKALADTPAEGFVNRVWQKEETGDLPGVVRIFLSDGTLVMDSCWETHRLATWRMLGENRLSWDEDGTDISARIADLAADSLTLVLDLKGGPVEEHYTAAPVPSVCPEMIKG
jgi:hypothetical protein